MSDNMANNCWYCMSVVGPRESIERLYSIMNYEDPKLYIYRVFEATWCDEPEEIEDGRYFAKISGDVAWSISSWLDDIPYVTRNDRRLYVNLRFLSDLLHLDFEIQSEEPGCAFQQHCVIVNGEVKMYQDCTWFDLYYDTNDFEDISKVIEDINGIIMKYDDIKEAFKGNDVHKNMIDEIYEIYKDCDYLSIELGGYGRDTVVGDDIIDGDVKKWKVNSYEIIY